MPTLSLKSDDTGHLQEAEQGQATPIGDRSRRIKTGNLVLDDKDYSPSSSAPEAIRKTVNATNGVDTETVHKLTRPQQEGPGIIIDLASGFEDQFSKPSISSRNPPSSTMYFTRTNARMESKVLAKHVVVPKDKRGPPRSREFGVHYLAATKALDYIFGVAKNFVPTCRHEMFSSAKHMI